MISETLQQRGYILDKYRTSTYDGSVTITFSGPTGYHTLTADTREELIEAINQFAQTHKTQLLG